MSKILLVEDDVNLREVYATRLMAEGYDVVPASDGEEALAVAVKEKPDLVVLDVMMPKISGFDVLDILRSTPETKDCKVIMMTALSQQSDRERGERLGANKYLVKSQVTLEDVVNTVKEMLGGPAVAPPPVPPGAAPTSPPPAVADSQSTSTPAPTTIPMPQSPPADDIQPVTLANEAGDIQKPNPGETVSPSGGIPPKTPDNTI